MRSHRLVEADRDVGPERFLDRDRVLGREPLDGAVEMRPEGHAVLVDLAQVAQAHDLEAARVGEDRTVPVHEPVEATQASDPLVPGPKGEVVRVREDDGRADLVQVIGIERLDGRVGAHRHEHGCLDIAVRRRHHTGPRAGAAVGGRRRRHPVVHRARYAMAGVVVGRADRLRGGRSGHQAISARSVAIIATASASTR
jgi:hypothetical protein